MAFLSAWAFGECGCILRGTKEWCGVMDRTGLSGTGCFAVRAFALRSIWPCVLKQVIEQNSLSFIERERRCLYMHMSQAPATHVTVSATVMFNRTCP